MNRTKLQAVDLAAKMASETGRVHVVRNTGGFGQPKYAVVALYEPSGEGRNFDIMAARLGPIVWSSEK